MKAHPCVHGLVAAEQTDIKTAEDPNGDEKKSDAEDRKMPHGIPGIHAASITIFDMLSIVSIACIDRPGVPLLEFFFLRRENTSNFAITITSLHPQYQSINQ